jgi:5'-3' exonuclease
MKMVNLLRSYRVVPVLVFDGGNLPSKRGTESSRREKREEAKEKGRELSLSGDRKAAAECFKRAVDVTPRMAFNVIEMLRKENVEFIVAPYEADAQLTYLCLTGFVDAVISEDSDLVPYGCPRMIYKLDKDGNGKEVQFAELGSVTEVDLSHFSSEMLRHMCILSGCDYLASLPGIGLKKAHSLLQRHGTMGEVFKALETSKMPMPPDYALNFGRADLTFQHQIVYDPIGKKTVHLHPLPEYVDPSTLPFAGEHLEPHIAQLVAEGRLDPHTYEPFILSIPLPLPAPNGAFVMGPQVGISNSSPSTQGGRDSTHSLANSSSSVNHSISLQATTIIPAPGTNGSSSGSPSTSSSGIVVSSSRLSTQWQSKSTTPLSALKNSLNGSLSASQISSPSKQLSDTEKAKHDNDMTRDVMRYTMYRGSGQGVKNAAQTASSIISSSAATLTPSRNTITSYYAPAKAPTSAAAAGLTMSSNLSPTSRSRSSSSLSTPTKLSGSNSANNIGAPQVAAPTVLKSRFFGGNTQPAMPATSAATTPSPAHFSGSIGRPSSIGYCGSSRSGSPAPTENLASYSAVWDDDEIVFGDELEEIIMTGSRPKSSSSTPNANAFSNEASVTAPLPELPKEKASLPLRSQTTASVVRSGLEEVEKEEDKILAPVVRHKVPVRLGLPKMMDMSNSDSDEEVELVRVDSSSMPAKPPTPPFGLVATSASIRENPSTLYVSSHSMTLTGQRTGSFTNTNEIDVRTSTLSMTSYSSKATSVFDDVATHDDLPAVTSETYTSTSRFDFSRLVVPVSNNGDASPSHSNQNSPTTSHSNIRLLTPQSYGIRPKTVVSPPLVSPTQLTTPNLKKRGRADPSDDGGIGDDEALLRENSPPLKIRAMAAAPTVDLFSLID